MIGPLLTERLTVEQQLYALHYNGQRLVSMLADKSGGIPTIQHRELYVQFRDAIRLHADWLLHRHSDRRDVGASVVANRARFLYESSARAISETLAISFVNYDQWSIGLGLVWTTAVLLVLVVNAVNFKRSANIAIHIGNKRLFIGSIALAVIQATFVGHSTIFTILSSLAITFAGLCLWSIAVELCKLAKPHVVIHRLLRTFDNDDDKAAVAIDPTLACMIVGTIVHAALSASSSFVEEEHQTWYALSTTALLMLAIRDVRAMLQLQRRHSQTHRRSTPTFAGWLALLSSVAAVRRLNQTGDKWLTVPDVGDWLSMPSHRGWQSVWLATGQNSNGNALKIMFLIDVGIAILL